MMGRLSLLALLTLTLGLTGCGSPAPVAPAGPAASPGATPAGGQISDRDEGRRFTLHVGDTVELVLHQQPGYAQWGNAVSSNPPVLAATVDVRAAAARGVTLAMFRAIAPGTAEIEASAALQCSPGVACAAMARLWKVSVQVA